MGAWHSISDPEFGESDIVLVVGCDGIRTGILIENKVDAPAQADQAARYGSRGNVGTVQGEWKACVSCIVAPRKYLDANREASSYHSRVSYEDICDWLLANTPETARRQFRLNIVAQAIEQNRRGRTKHFDECVSAFFRDYWQLAHAEFPELQMRTYEQAGANNEWPEFVPTHLKEKYRETALYHKINSDCVDLQFAGLQPRLPELISSNRDLLDDGVKFVARGKTSAALTIAVPAMNTKEVFANQVPQAREALKAAFKLSILSRLVILT